MTGSRQDDPEKQDGCRPDDSGQKQRRCNGFAAPEPLLAVALEPAVAHGGDPLTALSCLAVGVAFLVAVGLLVFAGVLLGWVVPELIERARRRRGAPPSRRD